MELAVGICYIGCHDERVPALLDSVHHAWQERAVTKVTRCWSPAVNRTDIAVRNSHNHISAWVCLAREKTSMLMCPRLSITSTGEERRFGPIVTPQEPVF